MSTTGSAHVPNGRDVLNGTTEPKITLYTNHGCGWSHRVNIVLLELGLRCDVVLIDMDVPRPEWFLKMNPRGLVPVLQYNTLTLTESAQIVAFLTDLHPSHLLLTLPAPQNPKAPSEANIKAAHLRYRMSFFVDTYFTKINPLMFKLVGADHGPSQEKIVDEILGLLEKEIEPLLFDTGVDEGGRSGGGKYFTGSERITFVEAMTTPFTLRLIDFCNDIIFPARLATNMLDETKYPRFAKWVKVCMEHPSVSCTWDKEYMIPRIVERLPAARKKYAPAV